MLKRHTAMKKAAIIGSTCVVLIALAALMVALVFPRLQAHAQNIPNVGHLTHAGFDTVGITPKVAKNAKYAEALLHASSRFNSIPFWGSAFSYAGTTYPYTMVGTNPAREGFTTTVPTEIIPVRVSVGGVTLDPSAATRSTANSPIFLNSNYAQGRTQYADAMQRAEWWNYAAHENYHVLLSYPAVESPLIISVPSYRGYVENTPGGYIAVIDENWWYQVVLDNLYGRHISPNVFALFLTDNVYLAPSHYCCILGYHDAVFQLGSTTNINTYAWTSYINPGVYYSSQGIADITAVSHEVAEWMNDPFGSNQTPVWYSPGKYGSDQFGCSHVLEVGSPLTGVTFTASTSAGVYHPQEVANFSWFARQKPSQAYGGRYSYLGTLKTYSTPNGCPS